MGIYNRIAGTTDEKKIGVWALLNDIWLQSEGLLSWEDVRERQQLDSSEFQELKSWFLALHTLNGNSSRQRTRSLAHQLLISIERADFTPATYDNSEPPVELTPRIQHRLTEAQVLTYLGL